MGEETLTLSAVVACPVSTSADSTYLQIHAYNASMNVNTELRQEGGRDEKTNTTTHQKCNNNNSNNNNFHHHHHSATTRTWYPQGPCWSSQDTDQSPHHVQVRLQCVGSPSHSEAGQERERGSVPSEQTARRLRVPLYPRCCDTVPIMFAHGP